MQQLKQTERSAIRRSPHRGEYDRAAVYGILDEGFVCHVGFVADGQPFVIPTGYGRDGDRLYIHGSQASRMLKRLRENIPVCVTVTLIDGLVLARSAFNHTMNYRSVVIFGSATIIEDHMGKLEALRILSEHMIPGRWDAVRVPDQRELNATMVLSIPLVEASAKIRSGPPDDAEADYDLHVWAGEIPLQLTSAEPVNDPRLPGGISPPTYARNYSRHTDAAKILQP